MSVETQRHAWTTSTRSPARKTESRAVAEPTIRLVFMCLSWHANQEGIAWPALSTLAAETEVDERTVRAAIDRLIERGNLELVRRGGKHQGANHYRIPSQSTGRQCPPDAGGQPGTAAHQKTDVNRAMAASQPGSPASQPGNSAHQTTKNDNNRTPASSPTYLNNSAREAHPTSGRQVPLQAHLADLRSRGVTNPAEFAQLDPQVVQRVLKNWDADTAAGPGALVTRLRDIAAGRGHTPTANPPSRPMTAKEERMARRMAVIQSAQDEPHQPLQLAAGK